MIFNLREPSNLVQSKHVYFKNCIRSARNFKNPTKTCAVRCQRAQISHFYGGLFPKKIEIPDSSSTSVNFQERRFSKEAVSPTSVRIWGTDYFPGSIVILNVESPGVLHVGVISSIVYDESSVFFLCAEHAAKLGKGRRLHGLQGC